MPALTVLACVVAGLVVGAYLPGVVSRWPSSRFGAGRGSSHGRFGWRPPRRNVGHAVIMLATGMVFGLLGARLGAAPELPAYLYLGAAGVALAAIDLDCRRLPNSLTLPSYVVGIVLLGGAALARQDAHAALRALVGMVVLFGVYYLMALIHPSGLGYGDVKLSGVLGLYLGWLGWGELVWGTFLGFLLSAVAGLGLVVARRATLKTALPFGPFMLAGALIAIVLPR